MGDAFCGRNQAAGDEPEAAAEFAAVGRAGRRVSRVAVHDGALFRTDATERVRRHLTVFRRFLPDHPAEAFDVPCILGFIRHLRTERANGQRAT